MGNPEPEIKKTEAQPEEHYTFPPCSAHPVITQNKLTGDLWLGFNPARMPRPVSLAWVAFQVEQIYAQLEAQIEAQRKVLADPKAKRSIRDIMTAPFRRA